MGPDVFIDPIPFTPFSEDFEMIMDTMGAGAFGVFMAVYILVMLLSSALSLVVYVLHSLSLYTIAQRRGIRHGWLAWIPVGNLWLLGSISDQYQYVAKGKIKNRRKVLLGLNIALIVLYVTCFVGLIALLISVDEVLAFLWVILGVIALLAVAITILVYEYIAYYDLFSSSEPNNATLYLVLSIIFSVTLPFFVFACRKKDLGMPPRKQPAQPVVIPTVEPVVDPNVVEKVVIPTVEPVVESTTEPVAEGFAQPEEFEEE